ncbi:MAG: hypothetical protein EOP93_05375 [Lysobacteraceae bacterium]|nr:MAG: hypothetical protein EOP93_05375 [Xanthomonadaceae bacterium]
MSVFLGWMPDAAAQAALAGLQQALREALPAEGPRHDWRTPAQWHMTLRYLGDAIDPAQSGRIEAAMAAFAADTDANIDASLVGAQYWPHARVLVAKIEASDALKALLQRLEAAMQSCGFARERAQTAHITLAYLPTRETPAQPPPSTLTVPLPIDRVHLLRTMPGGYTSLASWPLAGASPGA